MSEAFITSRAMALLQDPVSAACRLAEIVMLGALVPARRRSAGSQIAAYAAKCRRLGLEESLFTLSFDCDTPEDAPAAAELVDFLGRYDISPTLAVPGHEIEANETIYRELAMRGIEFINHGYLPHTEQRHGRYASITFYNRMPPDRVIEDICRGHEAVTRVTGRFPIGFRAPHFGHFQEPRQRRLIYETVRKLGYRYCSDTIPAAAMRHGPAYEVAEGLIEIPLSGAPGRPRSIFDSWNHFDQDRSSLDEEYFKLFRETIDIFAAGNVPGLFNHYVDPSHVVGQAAFEKAVEYLAASGIRTIRLSDLPHALGLART